MYVSLVCSSHDIWVTMVYVFSVCSSLVRVTVVRVFSDCSSHYVKVTMVCVFSTFLSCKGDSCESVFRLLLSLCKGDNGVCFQYVPLIVELCTRIVEVRGMEIIGVYRVPGNSVAVTHMQEELNRGIENMNMDNDKWLDVNVVSSLLKAFFRKLPHPLVTPGETLFLCI